MSLSLNTAWFISGRRFRGWIPAFENDLPSLQENLTHDIFKVPQGTLIFDLEEGSDWRTAIGNPTEIKRKSQQRSPHSHHLSVHLFTSVPHQTEASKGPWDAPGGRESSEPPFSSVPGFSLEILLCCFISPHVRKVLPDIPLTTSLKASLLETCPLCMPTV